MKAMVKAHEKALTVLTRKITALEHKLSEIRQVNSAHKLASNGFNEAEAHRFSAKGLRAHRRRLNLSADQFAALVGVSAQSIYAWEQGRVRPRYRQLIALATLRTMSKTTIQQRLKETEDAR